MGKGPWKKKPRSYNIRTPNTKELFTYYVSQNRGLLAHPSTLRQQWSVFAWPPLHPLPAGVICEQPLKQRVIVENVFRLFMKFMQKYEIWIPHNFEDLENYGKVVRILLLLQNICLHCFISFWLKASERIHDHDFQCSYNFHEGQGTTHPLHHCATVFQNIQNIQHLTTDYY